MTPYNKFVAITKSDTVNFGNPGDPFEFCDAIYVGTAGVVVVVGDDDKAVAFTCIAGAILPVKAKRVNDTNTVPTLMVALYRQ